MNLIQPSITVEELLTTDNTVLGDTFCTDITTNADINCPDATNGDTTEHVSPVMVMLLDL